MPLLSASQVGSAGIVRAHAGLSVGGLVTDVPHNPFSLVVDGLLAGVAAWYLLGVVGVSRRGTAWAGRTTAAFLGGLVLVFVAVGSGLAHFDDTSFPAYMTEHVLLMMTAPALLVLGRPVRLVAGVSRWQVPTSLVLLARARQIAMLGRPLAWLCYFGVMWAYLESPLYGYSLRSGRIEDAVQVVFFLAGLWYWETILGGDGRAKVSPTTRGIGLLLGAPFESALGLVLMTRSRPMYGSTLSATHLGGQLFWMESMVVMGVALSGTLYAWAVDDEHRGAHAASLAQFGAASVGAPPRGQPGRSATDELMEEALEVLRGGVTDPGDVLIRPDKDEA